jgi:hypothetical protein
LGLGCTSFVAVSRVRSAACQGWFRLPVLRRSAHRLSGSLRLNSMQAQVIPVPSPIVLGLRATRALVHTQATEGQSARGCVGRYRYSAIQGKAMQAPNHSFKRTAPGVPVSAA